MRCERIGWDSDIPACVSVLPKSRNLSLWSALAHTASSSGAEVRDVNCPLAVVRCVMDLANGPDDTIANLISETHSATGSFGPFSQLHYTAHNSQRTVDIGDVGQLSPV